jgi:hypothetical protein
METQSSFKNHFEELKNIKSQYLDNFPQEEKI